MKIFGISIVTIIIVVAAYYAGRKNMLSGITSKLGG